MKRTLPLLALAATLGFAAPTAADDLPKPTEVDQYMAHLARSNMQTIRTGGMSVEVQAVPDYFMYVVAQEVAKKNAKSKKDLLKKIKKLLRKNKKQRGKLGVIMKFNASSSEKNFFAMEGKLKDMIGIFLTGQGKPGFKIVKQEGKLTSRKYNVYEASKAEAWKGKKMSPMFKVNWTAFTKDPLTVHLVLKKDIDPEKVTELKIATGGFLRVNVKGPSGKKRRGYKENKIDFDEGSTATREKVEKISFEYPLKSPEVPAWLALLLEDADEEKNKRKAKDKDKDKDEDDEDDDDDERDDED